MKKTILFVDYENIQNIDLSVIQKQDIDIKIFLGQSQNKIPIELVQATQQFGQRVEWIKIEVAGNNALDFHIAFYLGRLSRDIAGGSFLVLSKDKGFDPLIQHINKTQIHCQRIENLIELSKAKDAPTSQDVDSKDQSIKNSSNTQKNQASKTENSQDVDSMAKIIKNLSNINKSKRPKTKKAVRQHIKSLLSKEKMKDQEIDKLLDRLFAQKKISEVDNRLTYNF
jgi:PIN domain